MEGDKFLRGIEYPDIEYQMDVGPTHTNVINL